MKEMIKRIREEKGGFTLAELLIVVAIVMVLVAIAVPVFAGSMDSANASTDEANVRSGYAQSQVFTLTKADNQDVAIADGAVYWLTTDAELVKGATAPADAYVTKGSSTKLNGMPSYMPAWEANQNIKYAFAVAGDGAVTVTVTAEATS